MKKLLIFTTILCLALASCAPASLLGVTGPLRPAANPTAAAPQPATPTLDPPQSASPTPGAIQPAAPAARNGIPNFGHIVLIMLENRDYTSATDGQQMPQLAGLAQQNVLLSNYYAVSHPSLPNYMALMSGSTQGLTSDCTNCFVNQPNLADEIEASGRTWKAYLEGLPSPCFVGDSGNYAQKHDPLLYFDSIRLNATRCDRSILPLTSLDGDLANNSLPNFSYIMPDLCNSGHSCPAAIADKWVGSMVAKLQASPALGKNSLIIIAFDEASTSDTSGCCELPSPAGGHVEVVLISPSATQGFTDNTPYSHYSLLKMILTAWNLPDLGNAAQAQAIEAPWSGVQATPSAPAGPATPSQAPGAVNAAPSAYAGVPIEHPLPAKSIPTSGPQVSSCASSSPTTAAYTVKICFADPATGSTLSGDVSVSAAVKLTGTTRSNLEEMIFTLNGNYLLTTFNSPYTFILPTSHWVDGNYTLSVEAVMRDKFTSRQGSMPVVFKNGITTVPVNTNHFQPTSGNPAANGAPFLVAAGGDGASGEPSAAAVTKLIASINPNLFLYLGDIYENGSPAEFYNWYGSTSTYFGQFRSITDPTIGNHEYLTQGASGYFNYWDNIPNYYSFNAGGWHFISLNANSPKISVDPGSAQYQWLQQDLAANAQTCTIVYYHQPLYNIGTELAATYMAPIWAMLAKYGVSIVLNGHDHDYQRWVPLDGAGQPSPNGVTEFVVGSAGHGIQKFTHSDSRVAYANDTQPAAFGILLLQLSQTGASFTYQATSGNVLDSGSIPCRHTSSPSSVLPTPASGLQLVYQPTAGMNAAGMGADMFNWITGSSIYANGSPFVVIPGISLTASYTYVLSSPLQASSKNAFLPQGSLQNGNPMSASPPG